MLTIVSCKENRDYFRDLYEEFTDKKDQEGLSNQQALELIIETGKDNILKKFANNTNKQSKLLLFYASFAQIRDLRKDDKNLGIFNNLITYSELVLEDESSDLILKALFDFYFILSESSEFKLELTKHIITNILNKKYNLSSKYFNSFNQIILDTNRKEICSVSENKEIFNLYFKYLLEGKNYGLLNNEKIKSKVKSLINEDKNSVLGLDRAYFYIMFSDFNTSAITFDHKNLSDMKLESEFINDIKTINVEKINKLGNNTFDTTQFIKNAKLRILFEISTRLNNKTISFDDLLKNYKVNIEDFEEMIFDGTYIGLFIIDINYETCLISVRYSYQNHNVDTLNVLKSKIGNLRSKIGVYMEKLGEIKV